MSMLDWLDDPNGRPFMPDDGSRAWPCIMCRACVAWALGRVTRYARVVSPAGVA